MKLIYVFMIMFKQKVKQYIPVHTCIVQVWHLGIILNEYSLIAEK